MSRRITTLRDIAEAAEVSIQTVSRVVRGIDVVAEPTRTRVLDAVRSLNYQPNLAARSLSAHRTGSVHVIDAVPLFHGHAATFVAICQQLAALGLHISTTIVTPALATTPEPRYLVPRSSDGIIVLGGRVEPPGWVDEIARLAPTMIVGRVHELPREAGGVAVDHLGGARQAVAHLFARGAREIVHVAGPLDWMDAHLRLEGYRQACAEFGLRADVLHANSWEASAVARLTAELTGRNYDGVFAANDQLALGCLGAIQRQGLSVPGDVRVVGFDDMAGADALYPSLTTVRQDFTRVGEVAVDALKLMLDGRPGTSAVLSPTLIIREST